MRKLRNLLLTGLLILLTAASSHAETLTLTLPDGTGARFIPVAKRVESLTFNRTSGEPIIKNLYTVNPETGEQTQAFTDLEWAKWFLRYLIYQNIIGYEAGIAQKTASEAIVLDAE